MDYAENTSLFAGVREDYKREAAASFTDSLTGLYNHGFFDEVLERELRRFFRYGVPFSLALIDIDGLGLFNRRRGPIQGDRALKEVASCIREALRESDLAARYMGDMFAVLLLKAAGEGAEIVVRRLGASIEDHFHGELTVSIGCVSSEKAQTGKTSFKKRGLPSPTPRPAPEGSICVEDSPATPASDSRFRVLIADDDLVSAQILKAMLTPLDCDSTSSMTARKP